MNNLAPLIGRILIAQIFLMSGFGKIFDFAGTQQYMAGYGMPLTALLLFGAIVFELAGGFSLLLGYKARWGAILLIVFLIPTTLIFHTALEERIQQIMFMKNAAIMGGLFVVAHFGSGPLSLDALGKSSK